MYTKDFTIFTPIPRIHLDLIIFNIFAAFALLYEKYTHRMNIFGWTISVDSGIVGIVCPQIF
jgi:hypothetical protein